MALTWVVDTFQTKCDAIYEIWVQIDDGDLRFAVIRNELSFVHGQENWVI